jgi:CDP-glucose 4,6-dehydratase
MNYLVTGGTGFLGSYLVKNLVDKKHDVTIVSTSIRDKTSLKTLKVNLDRVNLVKGDVRDFDFLRKLFNEYEFDYVYHLGAISEVRKCQSDAKLAYDVNVGGTINILECIRLYGNVKGVAVSSSDKAYGAGDVPYVEDQALNGRAVYEASKSCADIIARSYYSNFNIPVVVTRCSNLYGGGDANFSRLIPNTIKRLINGQSPIIWRGVKDSTREFIYVEDAVDAYISLMDNIDETKGQAYNIGGNVIKSIEEVVLMLIEKINSNIKVEYLEKDFPEITHQYLDSTKITNVTNWQPKIDFDTGINSTIDFYKKYYKND